MGSTASKIQFPWRQFPCNVYETTFVPSWSVIFAPCGATALTQLLVLYCMTLARSSLSVCREIDFKLLFT